MEAVIFVGVQGAGKSTFYQQRFFDTHVRINLDMLRTRERERILLEACLRAGQPFVVDNTNVLAAERSRFIVPARAAGFEVIGYYFRPELKEALGRNSRRSGKRAIPVAGVIGTYKRLQPPALEEGFSRIYSVKIGPDNEFLVTPWPEPEPAAADVIP